MGKNKNKNKHNEQEVEVVVVTAQPLSIDGLAYFSNSTLGCMRIPRECMIGCWAPCVHIADVHQHVNGIGGWWCAIVSMWFCGYFACWIFAFLNAPTLMAIKGQPIDQNFWIHCCIWNWICPCLYSTQMYYEAIDQGYDHNIVPVQVGMVVQDQHGNTTQVRYA